MLSTINYHAINAKETYALRHQILRPYQTLADCAYPLDDEATSYHVGAWLEQDLIGVGSLLREAQDGTTDNNSWRIRGMAVLDTARGHGVGGHILQALIDYASSQAKPGNIWCNGRTTVQGFYEHFGFVQHGPIFNLPAIGPHVLLIKTIPASSN